MTIDDLDDFLKKKERPKGVYPTDELSEFLGKKERPEEEPPTDELGAFLKMKEVYPVRPEEFTIRDVPERMKLKRPEELKPGVGKLPIEEYVREPRPTKTPMKPTLSALKPEARKKAEAEARAYGTFEWKGRDVTRPHFIENLKAEDFAGYGKIEKVIGPVAQAMTHAANTFLFGVPEVLHKKIWKEELPKPKTTYGEIAAGTGSLIGMIGPGAAVSPFKLSTKAAKAIWKGEAKTVAGAFLQGVERGVVTLSLAEGMVEWEGADAKEIAINKLNAMRKAIPTGIVLGYRPG